jgi:cytochrome P450
MLFGCDAEAAGRPTQLKISIADYAADIGRRRKSTAEGPLMSETNHIAEKVDASWDVPAHVPADRVFDVDLYNDRSFDVDMHANLARLYDRYPDIFFSPRSGGYWVVMSHKLITQVMTDPVHFSSRQGQIPPVEPPLAMIPLSLDPPAHAPYRMALMRHFGAKHINAMAIQIRALAADLIDKAVAGDEFEFVRTVGAGLPVTVFMQMMGLPLSRFDEFRELVLDFFSVIPEPRRIELYLQIEQEMRDLVDARVASPGDDLVSKLLQDRIGDHQASADELTAMSVLLFTAGMDTVANAAAFTFYYLAKSPDTQAALVRDPSLIPAFVEESLRMYGIVNTPRQVVRDVEVDGVHMKAGDMVFVMLSLAGRDERIVSNPNDFDLSRSSHPHMVFGGGAHVCAGQFLARLELRLLVEEWVKRVSSFSIAPGFEAQFRCWQVMALSKLKIVIDERR